MNIQIYIYVLTYIHTYIYIYIHIHICICIYMNIYMYIYISISVEQTVERSCLCPGGAIPIRSLTTEILMHITNTRNQEFTKCKTVPRYWPCGPGTWRFMGGYKCGYK